MDRYAEQRCKNGREHAVSVRALRPEEQQAELAWLSRGAGDVATSTTHDGPVHMGDEMPGGGVSPSSRYDARAAERRSDAPAAENPPWED